MKYQVGDLVLIKDFKYKPRPPPRLRPRPRLPLRLHLHPHSKLFNSFGMVTQAIKHSDIFEEGSTENDNIYVWFSQLDAKEYSFYENEITGEIVK